ncbi:MAG: CBS domain-containing protein [Microbacteriaceae bacterium]|nr:CBS domain-containing protein [Microbacteriaceae bacterium]MCI1207282.1 CBS domain-containing protein [Microbacteriaceae bacterium]
MSEPKIFVSRIAGAGVFDPAGDRVGKVRDVLVTIRHTEAPLVLGLIVEISGRRRVFLQINRITNITPGAVITTGLINMRRFTQRGGEMRIISEMLGRTMRFRDGSGTARIEDVALEQNRTLEWEVSEAFLRRPKTGVSPFSRGATVLAKWSDLTDAEAPGDAQDVSQLLIAYSAFKAADLASALMDLPAKRRGEVAENLSDERLADVLEELGPHDQLTLINQLSDARAAVVLDRMQPDDAADLIAHLAAPRREMLLGLMAPEEASDVRMLLRYDPDTAGGLMTTEPLICSADTTVAEGLALVSREEIPPGTATTVCVTLPPYDAPTGRYVGIVHFQRMLRYPPSERLGTLVDDTVDPLPPDAPIAEVARTLATYNLTSIPVVDDNRRLLGIITVDDVLDALLPEDWRTEDRLSDAPARDTSPGVTHAAR